MPSLDLSDAILSVELCDRFSVVSRPQVVGTDGRPANGAVRTDHVVGVVTAASPDEMERFPEYDIGQRAISIVTRYPLKTTAVGFAPDLVLWNGDTYMVRALDNYRRFGTGFVQVIAVMVDFEAPPT